jgi:hypothetical protein
LRKTAAPTAIRESALQIAAVCWFLQRWRKTLAITSYPPGALQSASDRSRLRNKSGISARASRDRVARRDVRPYGIAIAEPAPCGCPIDMADQSAKGGADDYWSAPLCSFLRVGGAIVVLRSNPRQLIVVEMSIRQQREN